MNEVTIRPKRKYTDLKRVKNQKATSSNGGASNKKKNPPHPNQRYVDPPTLVLLPNGKRRFIWNYKV